MPVKNQVQLITYPDSLGGSLMALNELLSSHFLDFFPGGVHILPPFPSSGDRGFAPLDYFEIDPKFGSWEDVREMGGQFDLIAPLRDRWVAGRPPLFLIFAGMRGIRRSSGA